MAGRDADHGACEEVGVAVGVTNKPWPKNGDESDWCTGWRKLLCVFKNTTGLGKFVKRRMNKRFRKEWKIGLRDE